MRGTQLELFPPGTTSPEIVMVRETSKYGVPSDRWMCTRCWRGGMRLGPSGRPYDDRSRAVAWARKHHRCRPFGSETGIGAKPARYEILGQR